MKSAASCFFVLMAMTVAVARAQTDDFYESLLREGKEAYRANRMIEAEEDFRIAAFGLLSRPVLLAESLARLAVTQDRMGRVKETEGTLLRFVDVERRFPSYSQITVEGDLKSAFESLLVRIVPKQTLAQTPSLVRLTQPAPPPPPAKNQKSTPAPVTPAPKPAPAPAPVVAPPPAPAPSPAPVVAPPPPAPTHKTTMQPAPAPAMHPAPAPEPESPAGSYREQAREYARRRYSRPWSIQTELVCREESLARAIRAGNSNVWFTPISYEGAACYRVLWGHYDSQREAAAAVSSVPAELRSRGPASIVNTSTMTK